MRSPSDIGLRIAIYISLIVLSVFFLVPFYILFMATLRGPDNFHSGPIFFLPDKIHIWGNWMHWIHGGFIGSTTTLEAEEGTLKETWFGVYAYGNTLFYGIFASIGSIGVASLAAYSLSKIRFRGSDVVFLFIVAMMFFPPQIFILPFIIMLKYIGLYSTRWGLLIIYIGLGTPFATFLLRNYFITIHTEIIESARLDGASETRIWARIVMPLARPAIAVTFIFLFTFFLSDYLFAAALTTTEESRPVIPYMVDIFIQDNIYRARPIATMGALLVSLPVLGVFLLFQRYFIRGLLLGAVKK